MIASRINVGLSELTTIVWRGYEADAKDSKNFLSFKYNLSICVAEE